VSAVWRTYANLDRRDRRVSEYTLSARGTSDREQHSLHCRRLLVPTYSQEEKRYQLEAVVQHCIHCDPVSLLTSDMLLNVFMPTSILLILLILSDMVEDSYLLHDRIVQFHDILTLDICAPVLFENLQLIADMQNAVENRLLLRIERTPLKW